MPRSGLWRAPAAAGFSSVSLPGEFAIRFTCPHLGEPMTRGYFRFPAGFKNQVVFTSEDDLWEVPLDGGGARRLTAGRGSALYPCFSLDGRQLAFSSAEEGHNEVYVMP